MHILLITRVSGSPTDVFEQFDHNLLLKLSPPLMKVRLLQFDAPMKVGNVVHVEVKIMGIIRQEWYNVISEVSNSPDSHFFTDVGVHLPGMFSEWQHKHWVRKGADGCTEIVDDIHYKSVNRLFTALIYPLVFLQFWYRKPIYRRTFGKPKP